MKRMSGSEPSIDTSAAPITTCDVAVVGYGPTGMMLAALLGRQGHHVVVLERYDGLYNLPRAACFDDEIMRTFQKLGLVEAVMPGTVVQTDYEWVNGAGEMLLEVSYDSLAPGGWAALYMMYQPHLETVLDGFCRSLPTVEVRQGVVVDGLNMSDDRVELTAVGPGDVRSGVHARFVIGADGGAGFVRPALGVELVDYAFQENWLVCDFHKRRHLPAVPSFRQVCDPAQPIAIVRIGPEHHRFSFMLDPDEAPGRATDPERVWERVAGYLSREDAELIRVANYVFRSRIAERWRSGPVMLAGDAAHEMPPFLAQGMCSGIRDSHNLAWKLDLVLTGRADAAVLDTYQVEREPHVRFITEKAIELGRVQTLRDPAAAHERDRRLIAQRRAEQTPAKIVFPGLGAGLVASAAPHAGERFVQGVVARRGGEPQRFDDLLGSGPVIVARHREMLGALSAAQVEFWQTLGGRVAVVGEPEQATKADRAAENGDPVTAGADPRTGDHLLRQVIELVDVEQVYSEWFGARDVEAVVVRPDWYVYGATAEVAGLSALLTELASALRSPARSAAPA
jgi:2-polyprenyl-6-methoxyphenol hydroxylase-like FAD-dependent oxidoreductase